VSAGRVYAGSSLVRSQSAVVTLHPFLEVIMSAFRSVWIHVRDRVRTFTRHRAPTAALAVAAMWLGAPAASGQTPDQHELTAKGHVPPHGSFSQFPWEHTDTLTGNVVLSFTDLVLPGHAGFRLVIQRTWNANDPSAPWHWAVGPTLHVSGGFDDQGTLTLPDGAVLGLVPTAQPGLYLTGSQFWRVTLTDTEHKAELPDGTVWFFQHAYGLEYFPVRVEDPFGNAVDVVWDWTNDRMVQLVQHVGTQTRLVAFTYDEASGHRLKTITAGDRTWQYVWSTAYPFHLTEVIPPEGPAWQFSWTATAADEWRNNRYYQSASGVATVTLPSGGWVRYETSGYSNCGAVTLCNPYRPEDCVTEEDTCQWGELPRLHTRTTGGRGLESGSWAFAYELAWWEIGQNAYDSEFRTTILGPNTALRHIHKRPWGLASLITPVREIAVGTAPGEANVVERTTFDWRLLRAWPGDPPPLFLRSYTDLVPTAVETVRAGRTYRRTFTYGDDTDPGHLGHFGQPVEIVETGDFTRTTSFAYQSFTGSRWLSDAVSQVTIDGVVTASAVYGSSTGFATSRTALGVTTTFAPDAWGNVGSQTDANGHTTTFDYTWGVVSAVHTPASTTTFGINPHGETISATQRGFTTEFTYDGLGRQTRVHPPVGNDTVTSYADDASWVKVARGPSWTITSLDGFGRAIGTENSVGVKTQTAYNALGQVTYASAPYTGVQHTGAQFTYDVLGRILTRTNADATVVHYTYDAAAKRPADDDHR
jgi:YD repeat-containing protein